MLFDSYNLSKQRGKLIGFSHIRETKCNSAHCKSIRRGGTVSCEEYMDLQRHALGGILFRLSHIKIIRLFFFPLL